MAHKILILFLVTLAASCILAKKSGRPGGIGRPDGVDDVPEKKEKNDEEDRLVFDLCFSSILKCTFKMLCY